MLPSNGKSSAQKKSKVSSEHDSCKKRCDKNPKIKEILKKEMCLMELAKKVNACFIEVNKDVEMEPPASEKPSEEKASPDSININTLLDEANKLSYS